VLLSFNKSVHFNHLAIEALLTEETLEWFSFSSPVTVTIALPLNNRETNNRLEDRGHSSNRDKYRQFLNIQGPYRGNERKVEI
jgi:hypothetical protein